MLDIKNQFDEDKLFNFFSSLQPWAQAELQKQNVKDLSNAITTTDGLMDYKLGSSSSNNDKKKLKFEGKKLQKYDKEGKKDKKKKEREFISKSKASNPP